MAYAIPISQVNSKLNLSFPAPPNPDKYYTLTRAEISKFDTQVGDCVYKVCDK